MEKLSDLREGAWNYVHTCMLVTDENVPCKLKTPFSQQTVNLLGLPDISLCYSHCSMLGPLGMVMEMLMLTCGVDLPWCSSEKHAPPYSFSVPLSLPKHSAHSYSPTDTGKPGLGSHTIN